MKTRSLVLEIARWEFQRWFKWEDQFVTLAISLALALAIWGGKEPSFKEMRRWAREA